MSSKKWFEIAAPLKLARCAARRLPTRFGHPFAESLGRIAAIYPSSRFMRAVKENQWVALGEKSSAQELRRVSKEVMVQSARCLYDFLYFLDHPEEMMRRITFGPLASACIERIRQNKPLIVAIPHLSNFDLAGYALARVGLNIQILSYPNPKGNYQYENQLREEAGLTVTPITPQALALAKQRLKQGGCVLTGVDRPIETPSVQKYSPRFFGRPTNLPVLHIRLALALNVPIVVLACYDTGDGRYELKASDFLSLKHDPDLVYEVVSNAEMVLKEVEMFIREAPAQWRMFYPLWPGALPDNVNG